MNKVLLDLSSQHRTIRFLRRILRPINPRWRRWQTQQAREFNEFIGEHAGYISRELAGILTSRTALVVGYYVPALAFLHVPFILGLRVAGFRVIVMLPDARTEAGRFYRSIGASECIGIEDFEPALSARMVERLTTGITTQQDLIGLTHDCVPIGKFVTSTLMRQLRTGSIDPSEPSTRLLVNRALTASLRAVESSRAICRRYDPQLICFYDRGYTPDGELFEVALRHGARATTLNVAHRSGFMVSKRYSRENCERHFAAPSGPMWTKLLDMEWRPGHWDILREEFERSYRSGQWYDEVGTQFNTVVLDRVEIVSLLELDPKKKTAVVFPHLFWDATFFWGEDLFSDYKEWFCEVLKVAARNSSVNWIIKVHPAGAVKDQRDGYVGEPSEMVAIRETLGELPAHMKLLPQKSTVSTYSLFGCMDYCLTVRGTIGIEAACFGATVLTAGTGRYDRYGFTVDSSTRREYIERIERLQEIDPPAGESIERARRYAFGLFLWRPLRWQSVKFHYRQDAGASMHCEFAVPPETRLAAATDISRLANWLKNDCEEDLLNCDYPPHAALEAQHVEAKESPVAGSVGLSR